MTKKNEWRSDVGIQKMKGERRSPVLTFKKCSNRRSCVVEAKMVLSLSSGQSDASAQ
jgi:hypothetical protein